MKHTTGIRAAAVATAVLAAGLATAGTANAAQAQATRPATTRITGQEQLRASILAAVHSEVAVCGPGASFGVHPMGGWTPPIVPPSSSLG
ncbi:hypothetical protein GXW83_21325 [Streptacidiphilus sp. PB12-B1b]|uniref:hypothetical protein n=1 Tax=Streptacidiphilus sp. PB12-B1b TaxID=2705012 RepID=UPI0015FC31BD|nr:hypothetical protein [Streptacidiphilus sp. PB12-B1b]QMU77853.1 hypothetical protein GXW83_21325 [Streptacidiphilus sp. PB12-B1b]